MKKVFFHACIITMLPCAIVSASIVPEPANPVQSQEEFSIAPAKNWKSGVDSVNLWYGADYEVMGDYASLSYVGKTRSLLYAMTLEAGSYHIDFETRFDDYTTQFNYWQVYLVRDDAKINLAGNPKWTGNNADVTRVVYDYAQPGEDDGLWHNYSIELTISAEQASQYDSMVFVFTGSRQACDVLDFGQFEVHTSTSAGCVPEPSTLILCGGGMAFLFGVVKKR